MFGNIMGGMASNNYYGQPGLHTGSMQNQQGINMANNAYAQNQAAFQYAAAQQAMNRTPWRPKDFRINGKDMDFTEFLDTLYSDDCPEKTYLALKLTKGED
jgi:hypothetical protein